MKKLFLLIPFFISILFASCLEDQCDSRRTYNKWVPVYVTEDGLRPEINNLSSRDLVNPGKIYTYEKYLFINELRKGVHVIDNSRPEAPVFINFIEIPGNVDIAIKGNILYADMYRDLVTIDISDVKNARLLGRQENVFESFIPFDATEQKYIVSYESTQETVTVDCSDDRWGQTWFRTGPDIFVDALADSFAGNLAAGSPSFSNNSRQSVGTGGSLARFTITKEHLYALDDSRINVFGIEQELLVEKNKIHVDRGIETIFPYKDYLFIGANAGMFIYDTEDPERPRELSTFTHARACDPVFVDDDIAYVTLRSGVQCANQNNQIDVIDVSNIRSPELLKSFAMTNPHGLSVLNDVLYLCEGEDGLKVFDVTDPLTLNDNRIDHIKNNHSFDVIALSQGLLMVIGADGLFQYDITNPEAIKAISTIPVLKN